VTYAFGARETDCWLHFLCKNIQLRRDTSGGYDVFKKSADDHSWNAAGYFLSWSLDEDAEKRRDKKKGKRISGMGRRDLYGDDSEEAEKISNVTLVCSGAPEGLEIRLKTFLAVPRNVEAVMQDPYALWIPVLVESWNMMDDTVWYLQELFGELENVSP